MYNFELSIGELAARTGVTEPTLRMWERRYAFPRPERTETGHRRYSEEHVHLIERVLVGRAAGLSLPAAIQRAQVPLAPGGTSLYSLLLRRRQELEPRQIRKPALLAFSRGIEDEALARAEAELMFACFQRESFYRGSQARWLELAECTAASAVFADFDQSWYSDYGPAEIPIARHQQIGREWAIVAYGGRSSVCMVARESASSNVDAPSAEREFEMVWTANPQAVRELAEACATAAGAAVPEVLERASTALADDRLVATADPALLTAAILNRTLGHLR